MRVTQQTNSGYTIEGEAAGFASFGPAIGAYWASNGITGERALLLEVRKPFFVRGGDNNHVKHVLRHQLDEPIDPETQLLVFKLPAGWRKDGVQSGSQWLADPSASEDELRGRLDRIGAIINDLEDFKTDSHAFFFPYLCPSMFMVGKDKTIYLLAAPLDFENNTEVHLGREVERFVHPAFLSSRGINADLSRLSNDDRVRFMRYPMVHMMLEAALQHPIDEGDGALPDTEKLEGTWQRAVPLFEEHLNGGVDGTRSDFWSICGTVLRAKAPRPAGPHPRDIGSHDEPDTENSPDGIDDPSPEVSISSDPFAQYPPGEFKPDADPPPTISLRPIPRKKGNSFLRWAGHAFFFALGAAASVGIFVWVWHVDLSRPQEIERLRLHSLLSRYALEPAFRKNAASQIRQIDPENINLRYLELTESASRDAQWSQEVANVTRDFNRLAGSDDNAGARSGDGVSDPRLPLFGKLDLDRLQTASRVPGAARTREKSP